MDFIEYETNINCIIIKKYLLYNYDDCSSKILKTIYNFTKYNPQYDIKCNSCNEDVLYKDKIQCYSCHEYSHFFCCKKYRNQSHCNKCLEERKIKFCSYCPEYEKISNKLIKCNCGKRCKINCCKKCLNKNFTKCIICNNFLSKHIDNIYNKKLNMYWCYSCKNSNNKLNECHECNKLQITNLCKSCNKDLCNFCNPLFYYFINLKENNHPRYKNLIINIKKDIIGDEFCLKCFDSKLINNTNNYDLQTRINI